MKVKVKTNEKEIILDGNENETISNVLKRNGVVFTMACNGLGICGKCKAIIENSNEKKEVLLCKEKLSSPITVYLNETNEKEISEFNNISNLNDSFAICLDLGTTTLVFSLIDLTTNKLIENYSFLNSQKVFGQDVMSRINSCINGELDKLNELVLNDINDTIDYFINKYNIETIDKLFVTGNTTMLHLLIKEDVSSLGFYPFTPKFLDCKLLNGNDINISANKVVLLPSFSSFVGADIVTGCLYVDINKTNSLLIDLGTNGEIVLNANNKLYTTSTAAGPAFEGNNIECGIGGVNGAINKVYKKNNKIVYETIGNVQPIGICGAGLFDAIYLMLQNGIIDKTGLFIDESKKFYISDNIYISAKDVRAFQLAKSAIRSGIEILIDNAKIDINSIDNVYIAGGLGFYLNPDITIKIGLIPEHLKDKIKIVGNSALSGLTMCLLDSNNIDKAIKLCQDVINIDLSKEINFIDKFAENMYLSDEIED